MAKKKGRKGQEDKAPEPEYPYRETAWHGRPLFECMHEDCFYDSLDEAEMQTHIERSHVPPEPREPVAIKIKDRYGNVVREERVV